MPGIVRFDTFSNRRFSTMKIQGFHIFLPVCFGLFTLFCTGCGQKLPAGMPLLHPTSITITQEDTPLDNAIVQLISSDPTLSQWGPSGITDANGVAVLNTNGLYRGAPEGRYKVLVTKREMEKHPHPEWANLPDGDPQYLKFREENLKLKSYDYVEPKYGLLLETPLEADIAKGKNELRFDVGKKVNIEMKRMM